MYKKGDVVKQVVPVISGAIVTLAIVDDEVQYLVEWTTESGSVEQRYFKESEIELA